MTRALMLLSACLLLPATAAARRHAPRKVTGDGELLQPYSAGGDDARGVLAPYPPEHKEDRPVLQPYPPGYRAPATRSGGAQLQDPYAQVQDPYAQPPPYPPQYPQYPAPQYPQYPQYPAPQYPQYPQYPEPEYPQPQNPYPSPQPYPQNPAPPYYYYPPPPQPPPYPPEGGYFLPPGYGQPIAPPSVVAPQPVAKKRVLAKLSLGYGYRWALGDNFQSGALEAEIGGEGAHGGGGARFGLEVGRTDAGLRFEVINLGPAFEWKLGKRFRFGIAPTLGVLVIERATRDDDSFWTFVFGTHFELSFDLIQRSSGGALYLSARIGYEYIVAVTDLSDSAFSSRLGLGYRF